MALSADAPIKLELGEFNELPVYGTETIYEGSMVSKREADGYAAALTAGEVFCGHALRKADNSAGASGAINVKVRKGKYSAQVALSGVAVTDVGQPVYASDDATLTLTSGLNSRVGTVARYVSSGIAVVEFEPYQPSGAAESVVRVSSKYEFDCQTTIDASAHVLIPAEENHAGLIILTCFARVTEVFAGGSEDQGVVTVSDESDNAICTLTASDAGADALNDLIEGYFLQEAATGSALHYVAAGEYVDAIITQATSGTTPAGKMEVVLTYIAL